MGLLWMLQHSGLSFEVLAIFKENWENCSRATSEIFIGLSSKPAR